MLKKILERKLRIMAKLVLKKYQPKIVAITGSVGKTSTREAIACVLSTKFRIRQNRKNYNNEIGLPLTILDIDSPGKSLCGWLGVGLRALKLLVITDKLFPEYLILEMGVDHPGDMEYLTSIAVPDIAVVTTVGQSHLEYFENEDGLAKEKGVIVKNLKVKGFAVLNYDDLRVRKMERLTKARVLTYGFDSKADIKALELSCSYERLADGENLQGLTYKLKYSGSFLPIHLPKVIGKQIAYASLAAASVAIALNFNMVEISNALLEYQSPKGRMRLVKGGKNTKIIDDTYNASPQSTMAALEAVGSIKLTKKARRWAVLGDMLELGGHSVAGHQSVGQAVAQNGFDYLVVVGEQSLLTMAAARDAGLKEESIFHFSTSGEAAEFVSGKISENDLLLVKGSQGMRMERIVKILMSEPEKAKELLVRQDWRDA